MQRSDTLTAGTLIYLCLAPLGLGAAPVKLLRVCLSDRPLSTSEAVASFLRGPAGEPR
jgi:hypothetical protein